MTFPSKYIRLWVVLIAVAILLPLAARAYRMASMHRQLEVSPLPSFPAHTVVLLDTSHGNGRTTQMTIIYARKRDGSGVRIIREADSFSPTGDNESKSIEMTPSGTVVLSSSNVRMKTTRIWGPNAPRMKEDLLILRNPATNCTKNFLGSSPSRLKPISETTDTVEGYPALKTVDDSGDGVWTVWRAPAFGCDTVRQHVAFKDGGYSDSIPQQLQLGEPDPALFEVPADFKEVSPLEMATASAQLHHRPLLDKQAALLKRFESKYQLLKPKTP